MGRCARAHRGQQAELHSEEEDQQQAQPKLWHRHTQRGDRYGQTVRPTTLVPRRDDRKRHGDRQADSKPGQGQWQSVSDCIGHIGPDRTAGDRGIAKIAAQQRDDPIDESPPKARIQANLGADLIDHIGRDNSLKSRLGDGHGRITRREP